MSFPEHAMATFAYAGRIRALSVTISGQLDYPTKVRFQERGTYAELRSLVENARMP